MKKLAALSVAVLCGLCACFLSCNQDADEEVWLFYATYNDDGTIGSSGLTQSEWESRLASIQGESTIVLSSELGSDDLAVFAAALIASGKTGIKLDLSNLGIVSINASTFSGCTAITSVVLPETVVSIGDNAFSGCTSLTSITIGSSLCQVDEDAFSGCTALTLVTYGGTTDDWDSIAIDSGNECLTEATVVCSDGSTEIITVRYIGSASEFDSVVAVVKADEITTLAVTQSDETIYCTLESETASDEGDETSYVWYFQDAGIIYTLTITVSGSSYTYDYSTQVISGTFTATLDGNGTKLGTVSVVVTDGEITSVTACGTACKEQGDGTYSYSDDNYTYAITISSSGGVFYYTYEITDGTFTASYGGTSSVFSTVVVTVSSGEITYITVDGTKCSSQDDDGKFTYSDSDYTYAISISSSNGVYSYTYDVTGGTFTASYSSTSSVFSAVTVVVSSGAITSVTADGTTCTAQGDGTYLCISGSTTYVITISGGNGSYSYSYETSEYFGSSGTTYEGFVTLLSSLSDGCTIVLSPYLTSTQLEYFAAALMNTSLSNVTVDMSCMTITEINEKTFYGCENITSVILPSCVEAIGSYAFYKCTKLTSVTIAEGTTSIGTYAFAYCSALTEVTIPDSVTSLGEYTFYYCTALETAVIGDGVETIPNYAFYKCTSLKTVTIGSAVTTINSYVFSYCTALETVYYNGTKSGWGSISIGGYSSTETSYGYLRLATIICTDGVYKY